MISGLYNILKNDYYAKYRITLYSKNGDTTIESTYRYDNKKLQNQLTQVRNTNFYIYKFKYWDLVGDFHQFKDSTVFKNGQIITKFDLDCEVNTNIFSLKTKSVYHYIKTKINYIDYYSYYDVSCTKLYRYKYLYDTSITTAIESKFQGATNNLQIYPNPILRNYRIIHFSSPIHKGRYILYNIDGKIVLEGQILNSDNIGFQKELEMGLYLLQVKQNNLNTISYFKLIVQ